MRSKSRVTYHLNELIEYHYAVIWLLVASFDISQARLVINLQDKTNAKSKHIKEMRVTDGGVTRARHFVPHSI